MLIPVDQPPTTLLFLGGLMDVVNFQLIETTKLYNKILRLDPNSEGNKPFNNQFDLLGYNALYILQNFGMLFFTLFTPLIAGALTYGLVMLLKGKQKSWIVDLVKI